jgi:uncharacterized membrane protein (DUF2068 family)
MNEGRDANTSATKAGPTQIAATVVAPASSAPGAALPELVRHHDPSLRVIALLVAGKSALALAIAIALECLGPIHVRHWIDSLSLRFHWNPDGKVLMWLLAQMNPHSFHIAAAIIVLYACVHGAEAFGLWFDQRWASWFGCIGAALYLPFDLHALWRHHTWFAATVVLVNVLVVFVLGRNIRNLRLRQLAGIKAED